MARRDDLSTPRGTPGGPSYDPDAFGPLAERFARFFGTVTYLFWQTIIVIVWIMLNAWASHQMGPVPVHPAQPRVLHPGRVRRAADPARPEPPG